MALWETQSVQAAWFLAGVDNVDVALIYEGLFGTKPDTLQTNRLPGPSNPFLGVASGNLNKWQAVLQLQPGRLDLIVQPDPNLPYDNVPPTLNSKEVADWLRGTLSQKSAYFPSSVRLAIICNFLNRAENVDAARTEIASLLNLDERLTSYSDLVFQLNRRRTIGVSAVEVNRLLRWATVGFHSVVFNNPMGAGINSALSTVEQHAASLMVDVNTVLGSKIFAKSEQATIFADMIQEVLRLGEIRTPLGLME